MQPTRRPMPEAAQLSADQFRLMADNAPVLIWVAGIDKLCTWFNKPWLDFVGRTMQQELGNRWGENVHPDDSDRCLNTYITAFDARETFKMEYRLRRHDGEYRWVIDRGAPMYGANQEFTGYIGSCIDITERKEIRQKLADELAGMRMLHELESSLIAQNDWRALLKTNPWDGCGDHPRGYGQHSLG